MGWMSSPQPQNIQYDDTMANTLRAQRESQMGTGQFSDLGPMWQMEAETRPRYEALDLQSTRNMMMGVGGQEGMLSLYRNQIQPELSAMEAESRRTQRAGDLSDVERFGQRAQAATLGSDPLTKQASDLQMEQSMALLNKPANLDRFREGIRSAQTARGLAYDPASASREALLTDAEAERQQWQRLNQLGAATGQRRALTGDVWQQLLSRPGQAFGAAGGYGGQGAGMAAGIGPRIYSPESQASFDLAMSNQQAQLGYGAAKMGMKGQMMGGLFQGLGAWGACHVAREVYGNDNPKWVQFFVWKETRGPNWFRKLYNKYSERAARFISNRPRLKQIIRSWMDGRIKEV